CRTRVYSDLQLTYGAADLGKKRRNFARPEEVYFPNFGPGCDAVTTRECNGGAAQEGRSDLLFFVDFPESRVLPISSKARRMRTLKHLGECAAGVVRCRTAFCHICESVHVWAAEWRPLSSRARVRLRALSDAQIANAVSGHAIEQ